MKLLIVSAYYWPEPSGNAPYVTDVAEHLAEQNHDVAVLTGFSHYPAWNRSTPARLLQVERRRGVALTRRWHTVPAKPTARSRAVYESSLAASGIFTFPGLRDRPDAVLGFCPALSDGIVTLWAARLARRPFAIVFQDLLSRAAVQSGVEGGRRVAGSVRAVEGFVARRAAAVGIAAEGFRPHLEGVGVASDKLVLLRNWTLAPPSVAERAQTRARLGWATEDFVCLHAGNMGQKQGLDNFVAAARLSNGRTRFVLAGDGNERARLESLAREQEVSNLEFLDSQPTGAYEEMLAAADVLVVNQRASVRDMALPSKLTSYFSAARPVVAAVTPLSEAAREIERAQAGVLVPPDNPEALVGAIARLQREPRLARELGKNGGDYAHAQLGRSDALRAYDAFVERLSAGDAQ
jgi:colanic acid biosynthesis glycosyl transferase WcaI